MSYQVFLTDDAAQDLEDLYDYIESRDAPEKADYVLTNDVLNMNAGQPPYPSATRSDRSLKSSGGMT